MSYLVLARKYRPQTFEDVVGQKAVVRTLRNALTRNRVAHAMIFSGVRGVGKTTLARIMAKALNCASGPTATPCNHCESCLAIADASAIDLHEIDGASNRGIQEIRELKENIRFFPTSSRYKIIIIDEVHMLTTEAFNALLKTLEEPPEHVFFMFATTELHKVPITILSRCQRYELARISSRELGLFFQKVAGQERVLISEAAVAKIVSEADGSVRDGLSLLDQVFSFADTATDSDMLEVADDDVVQILGLVDSLTIANLAAALLRGDLSTCISLLNEVFAQGVDLKRFTNDLLTYFRSLLVCKILSAPAELLDTYDQELEALQKIASQYDRETLHSHFQLLLEGVEQMQYARHPRLLLEMTFVQATQAGTIVPVADLLGRLNDLLRQGSPGVSSSLPPVTAEENPLYVSTAPAGKETTRSIETVDGTSSSAAVDSKKKVDEPAPRKPVSHGADPEQKDIRADWDAFIGYVMERKKWMALTLKLCSKVKEENNILLLKFDDKADCKMLQAAEHMKLLVQFAQDFFQRDLQISIQLRGNAETAEGEGGTAALEERRALANNPLVQIATDVFDGRVVNIRTGPRSR
jgi:DNA polymerase-3 subunit gamma/tau